MDSSPWAHSCWLSTCRHKQTKKVALPASKIAQLRLKYLRVDKVCGVHLLYCSLKSFLQQHCSKESRTSAKLVLKERRFLLPAFVCKVQKEAKNRLHDPRSSSEIWYNQL